MGFFSGVRNTGRKSEVAAPVQRPSTRGGDLGWRFAAGVTLFLGVALTLVVLESWPPGTSRKPAVTATPAAALPAPESPPQPLRWDVSPVNVFSADESTELIPEGVDGVATVAGMLAIAQSSDEARYHLVLEGQPLGLSNDYIYLLAMTRHPDQDIVLVGSQCGGAACDFLDLAFVRLYPNRPPELQSHVDFRFESDFNESLKQRIAFRDGETEVALGLVDGAHRFAVISPAEELALFAEPVVIEALTNEQCTMVKTVLEECAAFRTPCSQQALAEFPANCPDAMTPFYRTTGYLAQEIEGLDLRAFAQTCAMASRIRLTPSDAFIKANICSGVVLSQRLPGVVAKDTAPVLAGQTEPF